MPIYRGTQKVTKLYRGSQEVVAAYRGSQQIYSSGPDVFTGMWGPTTISQGQPKTVVFTFVAPASGMYQVDLVLTGDAYSVLKEFSIDGTVVQPVGGTVSEASAVLAVRQGEALTFDMTQRVGSATMSVEYTVALVPSDVPYSGTYSYSQIPKGAPGKTLGTYMVSGAGQYRLRMDDTTSTALVVIGVYRNSTTLSTATGPSASINITPTLVAGDAIYFRVWTTGSSTYTFGGSFSAERL